MKNKGRIILSVVGVIVSFAILIASAIIVEREIVNPVCAVTIIVISLILVWISTLYAAKIEYETSVYECRKCGHTFKPEFKTYIRGAHTLTTRHLKCPKCEEKSWCIRKNAKV